MTQKPTFDYDYIIIGSGAAGSPAAGILARSGKKIAVVEKSTFGGESPNWGDIPTGAMIHAAAAYHQAKTAAKFGLRTNTVGYNYPSLLSWKQTATKRTGVNDSRRYYEKQGISVFAGNAHFLSPNEITVNRRHLSARKFLIATGSEWNIPNLPGLTDTPYHTPKTILNLTKPPKSLFIIGSGATALELAHLFSSFGTKVYIAERSRHVLPTFDHEVSELLAQDAKKRGITLLPLTRIIAIQKNGLLKRVTFVQGNVEHSVRVGEILIADGRIPATDLGLENAGIKYNAAGIAVNASLQTSARHIFAAGSVVDTQAETHAILEQSRICAHNLQHRNMAVFDSTPTIRTVFTHPQIAQVGVNQLECQRTHLAIKTSLAPLTATTYSNITDERSGFVKLIANKKRVIIGGTIVASHASEMIGELALAVRHGLTAEQLVTTPHCFTTASEAVRIAAGKLL